MSAALASVPKFEIGNQVDLTEMGESDADQVRENIKRAKKVMRTNIDEYQKLVDKVVTDTMELLRSGAKIDVQKLIDTFLESERETRKKRKVEEKQQGAAIRKIVANRPDLATAMSELIAAEQADYDRISRMYRDWRWALMQARAEYQPSEVAGTIKGQMTEAEGYLKNIG
jgi:hypothetical protein